MSGVGSGASASVDPRDMLREAEIGADVLSELTDGDLEKLGVPLGNRKRLLGAIASLVH